MKISPIQLTSYCQQNHVSICSTYEVENQLKVLVTTTQLSSKIHFTKQYKQQQIQKFVWIHVKYITKFKYVTGRRRALSWSALTQECLFCFHDINLSGRTFTANTLIKVSPKLPWCNVTLNRFLMNSPTVKLDLEIFLVCRSSSSSKMKSQRN